MWDECGKRNVSNKLKSQEVQDKLKGIMDSYRLESEKDINSVVQKFEDKDLLRKLAVEADFYQIKPLIEAVKSGLAHKHKRVHVLEVKRVFHDGHCGFLVFGTKDSLALVPIQGNLASHTDATGTCTIHNLEWGTLRSKQAVSKCFKNLLYCGFQIQAFKFNSVSYIVGFVTEGYQ